MKLLNNRNLSDNSSSSQNLLRMLHMDPSINSLERNRINYLKSTFLKTSMAFFVVILAISSTEILKQSDTFSRIKVKCELSLRFPLKGVGDK